MLQDGKISYRNRRKIKARDEVLANSSYTEETPKFSTKDKGDVTMNDGINTDVQPSLRRSKRTKTFLKKS